MKDIKTYRRIVVLGAAESGIGAALLAMKQGHDVFVSDKSNIKDAYKSILIDHHIAFEEGAHTIDKILSTDLVIKSPGIPEKSEIVQLIRKNNIALMSEIDFAYCYKGQSKIIAITGSNGKSTTTALIYHILKQCGFDVALVGNIGYSFAKQVAENPTMYYVIEVSSFQLDDIYFFRPHLAILLNITEDHLDRYDYNFETYIYAKFRITAFQNDDDYFIYCEDDVIIKKYMESLHIRSKLIPFSNPYQHKANLKHITMDHLFEDNLFNIDFTELSLQGKHNQYNILAASLASSVLKIKNENIREALKSFKGLEHRMEFVAKVKGVEYINDSKSTNINSTWYALESMTKKTILVLGGIDKGNDYSAIESLVKEKVRAIICLGKDNQKIVDFFKSMVDVYETDSMALMVKKAYEIGEKNDVVLLSPACASFDLFKNYEDRGQQFKQYVKQL